MKVCPFLLLLVSVSGLPAHHGSPPMTGAHGGHPLSAYLYQDAFDYNPNIKPHCHENKATEVNVNTFVRTVGPIEEHTLHTQLTLRQVYKDHRLAFDATEDGQTEVHISGENLQDRIWLPDTFVRNEVASTTHSTTRHNQYARIAFDGTVHTSQRISLEMTCPNVMKTLLAAGEAECLLQLASYGYHSKELMYKWFPEDPVHGPHESGQMLGMLGDKLVKLAGIKTDSKEAFTRTGGYSILSLTFQLKTCDTSDCP